MIRKATILKLTNKIIRSFASDLALTLPFILLLLLMFRRAVNDKKNVCNSKVAWWLLIYLGGVTFFTFLKLLKIPILRTTSLKNYVYFWIGMSVIYYVTMFGWFIYGVKVIYSLTTSCPRLDKAQDDPAYYDAVTLKALMAVILTIYWVMMILFIQIVILILCIRSCWKGIKEAAANMVDNNFDIKVFVLEMTNALGQGEWQDSLLIGSV